MRSFLDKFRLIFSNEAPDSEIIGDVKFNENNTPYFSVKMLGCSTFVDIDAEDIIEKFTNKFNQNDIKKATKVFMKYRTLLRLVSIEKNFAILYNQKESSYNLIDLSDNLFLRNLDLDSLRPEDAFKLAIHFERMRLEKDRKLFNLTKSGNNITQLRLVASNDNEYTIACLLDESSHRQLKNYIPFLEKLNKPHISLFQFKCSDFSLAFWKNQIRLLKISSSFFTAGINLVEDNIFLDIADNLTLKKASDSLAEAYFIHCYSKEPLSQIQLEQLTFEQNDLVKKYGIYWIKQYFRPHVTLAYTNNIYNRQNLIIPDSINITKPEIYLIDNLGRIKI